MPFVAECPQCARKLQVPDANAGARTRQRRTGPVSASVCRALDWVQPRQRCRRRGRSRALPWKERRRCIVALVAFIACNAPQWSLAGLRATLQRCNVSIRGRSLGERRFFLSPRLYPPRPDELPMRARRCYPPSRAPLAKWSSGTLGGVRRGLLVEH
jgi:hypothetical protein